MKQNVIYCHSKYQDYNEKRNLQTQHCLSTKKILFFHQYISTKDIITVMVNQLETFLNLPIISLIHVP